MTSAAPALPMIDGIAERWRAREHFVVVIDRFDGGALFTGLWTRWREDPHRCARLAVIALDPPATLGAGQGPLRAELSAQWPPPSPDLHTVRLDGDRVQLQLAFGDAGHWWRELVAPVDAFCIAASADRPHDLAKAFMRLAAPDATVHGGQGDPVFMAALRARGFDVSGAQNPGTTAQYRPPFTPRRPPTHGMPPPFATRHALVLGAGLAGAATARSLARLGWRTTVLDRQAEPASEASGNPAGLFHGIVTPDDGPHARFNRAASFQAHEAVSRAIAHHGVAGGARGLLRLGDAGAAAQDMTALLDRLKLPEGYVQAVDAAAAAALCGVPLDRPAWWYPQGGWVEPAGLVRAWFAEAGPASVFRGGVSVARLARHPAGGLWQAFDDAGVLVAESEVVVLANGQGAAALLDAPGWPLQRVRGQISSIAVPPGLSAPHAPIAGGGYVMPPLAGRLLFGATAQPGDMDASVRASDHAHNVRQLNRMLGTDVPADEPSLAGRTAWRCVSEDRLPLAGAVPDARALMERRPEQARLVPRQRGLYVLTALGSRGITWSALCGDVVASAIAGGPAPLPASLLQAVDPARFLARAARRGLRADGASAG